MEKTRTILMWYDNDSERLVLPVNPARLTLTRTQETRAMRSVNGDPLHVPCGPGLRTVKFRTFLPHEDSPFYGGTPPVQAVEMLERWQEVRRPIRLIISEDGVNGAFLLTSLERTLCEGDRDVEIAAELREYLFTALQKSALSAQEPTATAGGLAARADERPAAQTYTVRSGDTLWAIAVRFYGDGTRWKTLADSNGIRDPKNLPIGKVLVL